MLLPCFRRNFEFQAPGVPGVRGRVATDTFFFFFFFLIISPDFRTIIFQFFLSFLAYLLKKIGLTKDTFLERNQVSWAFWNLFT